MELCLLGFFRQPCEVAEIVLVQGTFPLDSASRRDENRCCG